ncbi:MAG: hypothetical protein WCH34_16960, partial [Bacteroidota bacterium]
MSDFIWLASHNAFRRAMEKSLENALGITAFTRNALFANRNNPNPGFMLLYTETNGLYEVLLNAMGGKQSKGTTKMAYTDYMELQYSDMKKMLNHFDGLTRPVFEKDTLEYDTIWGSTRDRFYLGSYEMREISLKGLAESMNVYPDLEDVATEVMAYHNKLKQARETQQGLISGFKTDSKGVRDAVEALILQQDRNLGWLK